MKGSCRQTMLRPNSGSGPKRLARLACRISTMRATHVRHATRQALSSQALVPASCFGCPSQTRKARSKRIIRTHKFLMKSYINSPHSRQRAPFARYGETHSNECGSQEIPASNKRLITAARQLGQEQSVFECGPKRRVSARLS